MLDIIMHMLLETWQLSTVWAKNYISKQTISMSKSAGYFQNFPAVDLKIESNNKEVDRYTI